MGGEGKGGKKNSLQCKVSQQEKPDRERLNLKNSQIKFPSKTACLLAQSAPFHPPCVSKVLHPHPGDNNPDPSHDTRQHHQGRVVADDGQRRVVLQLRGRIGRLADVPGPAPDTEAGAHADDKDDPGDGENNVAPGRSRAVVPFVQGDIVLGLRGLGRDVGGGAGEGGALAVVQDLGREVTVGARHRLSERRVRDGGCVLSRCHELGDLQIGVVVCAICGQGWRCQDGGRRRDRFNAGDAAANAGDRHPGESLEGPPRRDFRSHIRRRRCVGEISARPWSLDAIFCRVEERWGCDGGGGIGRRTRRGRRSPWT